MPDSGGGSAGRRRVLCFQGCFQTSASVLGERGLQSAGMGKQERHTRGTGFPISLPGPPAGAPSGSPRPPTPLAVCRGAHHLAPSLGHLASSQDPPPVRPPSWPCSRSRARSPLKGQAPPPLGWAVPTPFSSSLLCQDGGERAPGPPRGSAHSCPGRCSQRRCRPCSVANPGWSPRPPLPWKMHPQPAPCPPSQELQPLTAPSLTNTHAQGGRGSPPAPPPPRRAGDG